MYGMMRFISNFKEFYNDINGATLTGAIDVIVVEQPDGSFSCSPFHVRFGKLGVLRSKEKVVDIEINGQPFDIHMKLGESGEAFFVEELEDDENDIPEHLATSPILVSELENIFKTQGRRRSFDLEDIKTLNIEPNSYTKRRHTADNQLGSNRAQLERDFLKRQIVLGNIEGGASVEDVTLSLTTASKRSEDDISRSQNDDISETIFRMDSLEESLSKTDNEKIQELSVPLPVTPVKPIEEPSCESKSSKKKRKKMRKKNATRKAQNNNNQIIAGQGSDTLERTNDSTTDRSSLGSNYSEHELKELQIKDDSVILADAPSFKKIDADFHFFSDTELTSGNVDSRASSPVRIESVQSDSEIEVKFRIKDDCNESAKSWEWGGFPSVSQTNTPTSENPSKEEHKSMLSSMFSFMKSKHNSQSRHVEGGMYLSEITSDTVDQEIADVYFNQKRKAAEDIDMDCESGNGPSLIQSPNSGEGCKSIDSDFEEQTKLAQSYSHDVSMSLCGWDPQPSADRFLEHLVTFSDLCNNPVLFENPNLVVRVKDKYYTWKVAAPIIASVMIYGRSLLQSTVDQLCSTYMPQETKEENKDVAKQQEQQRYSWWMWRRSKTSRETTPLLEDSVIANKAADTKDELLSVKKVEPLGEIKVEVPIETSQASSSRDEPTNISSQSKISTNSDKYRKVLRLSSKQIASLNLKNGVNEVEFSVTTAYQGTSRCRCNLYRWKWDDKIVISDIDGTITKSDVLGHILPIVGKDWAQSGVAQLFNKIRDNGYKLLYLSARAIGQARITREYLKSIRQGNFGMPDGPILLNPTSLITAFHREVIEKKPEQFKISCMSDIKALFPPDSNPFYAGYGNRINDVWAYRAVGIPIKRIFTINPKGELKHELTQTFQSSYTNMSIIVDQLYPSRLEAASDYSQFNYWREPITPVDELPAPF
ncbi:phosphatidate phosphatase LPIN3 isoform X2 [Cylas formicarius]|uniref:phosphatidate phosphatase LPIN3 isoform X2 n=1 Tax=Cylas formicarius TaxID=197179 RepID=UPI0029583C16|nr:phosphatidate phosphatase LPIN3 isoform X2 [Cylas formicarius]